MNYEQEYLLHLVACGAMDCTPALPEREVDWDALVQLAGEHTVTLAVGAALRKNPDIPVPQSVRDKLVVKIMASAKRSKLRRAKILALLAQMEQEGLSAVVLKGMNFAVLYGNPECREAIDTDILVDSRQEKAVLSFFRRAGFMVVPRTKNEHHGRCYRRDVGTFEIHVRLWQSEYDRVIFQDVPDTETLRSRAVRVDTDVGSFHAPCAQDNLLFSTLHFIKHFVFTGVSVRKVLDIAQMYAALRAQVDEEAYWQTLRRLDFEKLMQAVYGIAGQYFALDLPPMGEAEDKALLLEDLFDGGYNGRLQKQERLFTWEQYLFEKSGRKYGKSGARLYRLWRRVREGFYLTFPSREQLMKAYSVLEKKRWLYLFCALHRLATRGVHRLHDTASAAPQGNSRTEMLKKLGIL